MGLEVVSVHQFQTVDAIFQPSNKTTSASKDAQTEPTLTLTAEHASHVHQDANYA